MPEIAAPSDLKPNFGRRQNPVNRMASRHLNQSTKDHPSQSFPVRAEASEEAPAASPLGSLRANLLGPPRVPEVTPRTSRDPKTS